MAAMAAKSILYFKLSPIDHVCLLAFMDNGVLFRTLLIVVGSTDLVATDAFTMLCDSYQVPLSVFITQPSVLLDQLLVIQLYKSLDVIEDYHRRLGNKH